MAEAVTNEPGRNRAEKFRKTAPKILGVPGAKILKLADRIANLERSIETGGRKLTMYLRSTNSSSKSCGVRRTRRRCKPCGNTWRVWWPPSSAGACRKKGVEAGADRADQLL
jgi:hypothetical protein